MMDETVISNEEESYEPRFTWPTPQVREFNPWLVYAICLGVSLVFMFFFGLNSPLHTFNSHCDYQWFMTMGRGIVAGKVPYRDLFEQKGPIIYLVFAVASLFPHPQIAVWCIEILCISLFLFFCYRIARKFLSPWLALLVLPMMMMVLSTNYARGLEGSCVEEYCFPIFAYGLLCFLDFIMDRRPESWQRSLALGICMGILFWVKFTLLEFFLVPLIIWFFVHAKERDLWIILRTGLIMLGGVLIVTIPVIIGFAAVGALDDLFAVYIQVNINAYDGNVQNGNNNVHTITPWRSFRESLSIGVYYIIMLIFGVACFAVHNWHQKSGQWLLIAVGVTWVMVGFFCGYFYYYLPLFTYSLLGVIYAVKIPAYMLTTAGVKIRRRVISISMLVVAFVISMLLSLPFVSNLKEINRPRSSYAPLVVADIIQEYNATANTQATLFCYYMSDCGFYNAAGLIPNVRYYAENGFTRAAFPEMFDSFDATIKNRVCDFVVTYLFIYRENEDFLKQYYHPYFNNDLTESTLPFNYFEPNGYGKSQIVILFRNEK